MTPGRQRTPGRLLFWKLVCFIFKHAEPHPIGALQRKGFAPAPVYQCPRCSEIFMQYRAVKRLGGKAA